MIHDAETEEGFIINHGGSLFLFLVLVAAKRDKRYDGFAFFCYG